MNTRQLKRKFRHFVPVLLAGGCLSAQPYELKENTWSNPEFVNWFTGSYAFDGQVNPRINSDEKALFKEIAPMMQRNPEAAIGAIEDYIAEGEGEYSPALDYTLGSLHLQTGSPAEAARMYRKAIDRFPTFRRAFQNLGLVRVQAGNHAEAIPVLTKALELGANSGIVWGLLGYSYLNLDKPTQALAAYNQALVFQPESEDWKIGKVNALLDANQLNAALGLLDELIAEDPADTSLWLMQANAFLGEERNMDAAANLEWVARKGSASVESLLLLGDLYLNEGMPSLAVNAYEASMERGEPGADRLLEIVKNLSLRGSTEPAQAFLGKVRETLGEELSTAQELQALNFEAQLALAAGDREEAAELLERILELDPMNGSALIGLGDYYRNTGETEKAILQYERAVQVEEVRVEALLALGRLHVGKKKYRKALRFLREAQAIEKHAYVADYIEQLERAARDL